MWILSALESSDVAVRLTVGEKVSVPAICCPDSVAPLVDIVDEFDATVTRLEVGDRAVTVLRLDSGASAVVSDVVPVEPGRRSIRGFFQWDPYWFTSFPEPPEPPQLYGTVVRLALIVRTPTGNLSFLGDDTASDFAALHAAAKRANSAIEYRCLEFETTAGTHNK